MYRLSFRSEFACGTLALLAVLALAGCGRIGVNLLPAPLGNSNSDASVPDGGTNDSGAPGDAAMPDGSAGDGGFDAGMDSGTDSGTIVDSGVIPDSGTIVDAGMPDACPTLCENPNGTASCDTGSCVASCATGYSDCDGDPTNGCESDITGDPMSCGSCTNMCSNTNGSVMCASGLCDPTCNAGYEDCDAITTNGCETSLSTVTDCGACGSTCMNPHGTTSCVSGVCVPMCAAGFANCDGDPTNGCETNTNTDPNNCNGCGNACGTNLICEAGICKVSSCPAGQADCDTNPATCETNTTSSVTSCGFCGNACTTANGTPTCTASTCQVSSCNTNYANCDSAPANGCEVNLRTNLSNCGTCGTACTNAHGTTSCTSSACVPSCSTGWGDCDTSRPNGCETQLNSTSNCGSCGNTCPAVTGGTPICSSGLCSASCDLTGTWALKITSATTWPSGQYIKSGSGNHVFWLRMTATQSGNSVSESMIECGRRVPDFESSVVNETFGFSLQTSLFDHAPPYLPATAATLTLGNTSPGASVSQPLAAFLMGTTLSNPTTATWPSSSSSLTQVDMDANSNPGVTVTYLNGNGYTQPRTGSTLFSPRASNPYVASRLVFSLGGTLNSCTQASGSATVTHVDTRIFGCALAGGGSCNSSQWQFLDQNCLNYTVGTSTYQMVKIAAGASCSAVRSALP